MSYEFTVIAASICTAVMIACVVAVSVDFKAIRTKLVRLSNFIETCKEYSAHEMDEKEEALDCEWTKC